jgi:hypothetical protein
LLDPFVVSGPRRCLDARMIASLGSVLTPRIKGWLAADGKEVILLSFTYSNVCVGASWRWGTKVGARLTNASGTSPRLRRNTDGVAHLVGL